jgi:hypothetical protein
MRDCHMHCFLVREWLFVGQDVTYFDVVKHVSHGDVEGMNADITSNAKEVQPYLMHSKGSQLMVGVTNHGYSDH